MQTKYEIVYCIVHSRVILILISCWLLTVAARAQIQWATKSGKSVHMDFYNDMGIGYGMHTPIITEQINISIEDCVIGFMGQFGSREYIGTRTPDPNTTINRYRFINEYAVLIGKEFHTTDQNMYVVSIGPVFNWHKYREWPDKGSGVTPIFGPMLNRVPSDDSKNYGFRINAEVSHSNLGNTAGIGLGVFFSYTRHDPEFGGTLNFLLGAIR